MPSWKKVIISGSDAALNSLDVTTNVTASSFTGSFTGSFLGTASYALQALSASYASSASLADSSENVLIYVRNQSGYNIAKGLVVRITGSNNSSDIPRIVTASYENDDNSANTLGIASQTINDGSEGYVITEGILTGINTTGYTSGQLIYLGANGTITGSAPIAPLHAVRLGEVVRQQSNNGSIYVRIDNGYELGELHNVVDNTTTSSYGDLLVKSGSVWTNSKQLTGSYGLTGSLTGTSFVGSFTGSVQGTSSFAVSASHAIFADTASFLPSTTNLNITSISASNATFQSASIGYLQTVTGSSVIIGDAYVVVNSSQTTRYAGLAVYESGSNPPVTASWNFDSQTNDWFYSYSSSAGTDYGVALFGPDYNTEGSPVYLTNNRIPKSSGSHHLNDSNISDDGSRVSSAVPVTVTGSITASAGFLGDLVGTASAATSASFATTASYVATASYTPNLQQVTTKGNTTTNNMIITGSLNLRSNGSNINAYLKTPSSFGSGISFQDANTTAAEFVHCGALGDSFYITSGFILNVLVDSNGNTGFKTTSPASTVDVNGDLTVRANAAVTGSITNTNSGFKSMVFTSGSSIANSTTNGTLFTISAGTYESVTMDYVVFDSTRTNKRAGTLRGTWDDNTTTIVFDETSTTDIGNTTAFTLDMVNNGSGTVTVRATNNVGSAMTIIYDYKLLG